MHSLFQLKYLMPMLAMLKPTTRWFQNTFFPNHQTHGTKKVMVDIYNRRRREAQFTAPRHTTNMRDKSAYITRQYEPAYIKEGMSYEPSDLFERAAGAVQDTIDSTKLAVLLQTDMFDIDDMESRKVERMCIEALVDHQVTVQGRGLDIVVDMLPAGDQTMTLLAAAQWDTGTAVDIYENIQEAVKRNRKRTGLGGGAVVVMGESARIALLADPTVQAKLDKLHYKIGEINMEGFNEQGVRQVGTFDQGNIVLIEYQEWYEDGNGVDQPMFPANKVLVANMGARTMLQYGAIQDFAASGIGPLGKQKSFMKSWEADDPSTWNWNLQTAPMPVPIQIGGFTTIVATAN